MSSLYGVIHDQITFTVSPEYFANIKFKQFYYVNAGFHDRVFVATIGFLATWWVGFFVGWFLSRIVVGVHNEVIAAEKVKLGFIIVFIATLIISFGVGLYSFLVPNFYDSQYWESTLEHHSIKDANGFMRVVFIHYASYLGGFLGLVVAALALKFKKSVL